MTPQADLIAVGRRLRRAIAVMDESAGLAPASTQRVAHLLRPALARFADALERIAFAPPVDGSDLDDAMRRGVSVLGLFDQVAAGIDQAATAFDQAAKVAAEVGETDLTVVCRHYADDARAVVALFHDQAAPQTDALAQGRAELAHDHDGEEWHDAH